MDRRELLRGTAAMGLLAAAGLPLVGCGGGSSRTAADLPAAAPVPAEPGPTPASNSVPRSKSQLYRRGEGDVALTEPVPTRTARPSAQPAARPGAEASVVEEVPPSKTDGLTTARRSGQSGPKADGAPPPGSRPRRQLTVATDDIPVGGGTVYPRHEMVITQPRRGVYAAFDAHCTHQGCLVADCANGRINCPCHGSQYSLEDGSVLRGPADKPLARRRIVVTDGEIREK